MKYYLIILTLLFFSCRTSNKYPAGGFDYPANVSNSDTNFYFYPLKGIASKYDVFWLSYAYTYYRPFGEPNLSIKAQPKEIFRLTYGSLRHIIIITLTEDEMTVKKGTPAILYDEDTLQLTPLERFHLRVLQRSFPLDKEGISPFKKRYLDSLVKLYPQLLDPAYYHKIYDKTIVPNGEKFSYTLTKTNLTKQQYNSFIQQINSAGFWAKPYNVECKSPGTDGYSFTLEANTERTYKVVTVEGCADDTTAFIKACQRIVDFAKMDKEINLVWKNDTTTVADSIELILPPNEKLSK